MHPQKELSDLIETHIKLNPNIPKAANLKIVRPLLRKNKHFKIVERKGFEPFGLLLLFKEKWYTIILNCFVFHIKFILLIYGQTTN